MKLTDFHTHTLLSDGALMPAEHIRRLIVRGLYAVAITDHVDSSNIDHVLKSLDNIPVIEGTNKAALKCPDVDILAHPGILKFKDAQLAKDNKVFLEITTRGGHSLGNGLVAELAMKAGAKLILNTDAHQPRDFLSESLREKTALGSGIPRSMFDEVFVKNPEEIIKRIIK